MALFGGGSDVRALVDDPETFLKVNRLGVNLPRNFAKKALVKLVRGTENSYDLKMSETESDNTTLAYVLGYKTNDALSLDIPRTGVEEGTFFFTAELSGCSVVVTLLNNNTYRVFHDYRVNSAVLYDNVVMCVDWDNYKIPGQVAEYGKLDPSKGRAVGHAVACMQFRKGKWKLFVQRQYQGPFKQSDGVNWEVEVHLNVQSEHVYISLQTSFEEGRRRMQQKIKALGKKLGIASAIINRAEDATYGGSREFDENDASIRGWQDLRNAIQEKLKKTEKEAEFAACPKAMDPVFGKHRDMLDAAQKLDRIWLWLQIKKATGTSGNESKRGEVQPNDTISERYAEMERDVMSRKRNRVVGAAESLLARNRVVGAAESLLAGDRVLRAALTMAEAYDWATRWRNASRRLVREEGLMEKYWTPLLDTLHESTDGFYKMQYMNGSNTQETRWVSTRDKTFKEFTSYLHPKWNALRKDFTFENGKFKVHAAVESHPIDGLNAMFAVQTIIGWLNSGVSANESAPSESINSNLLLAMKWHSYVNVIQIGHTSLLDIHNLAALVKTAIQGEQLAGKVSLSTFGNVFKSMATEGFGFILGFASVGLDVNELWLARDSVEKATFGTQLAFDLASSVAGVARIGAGIVGASGVAMALSGAGVILGGLGFGVGALAGNFGKIASDAQEVGKYFAAVDEAYSGGGYIYKTDEKTLVPLLEAVVTRVQMVENHIEVGFDSQFIYRTHHGCTGSGRINYFFWVGDMPRMVKDRSQAINVREGIGYNNDRLRLMFGGEADILVLPATPKSFISYEYQLLPFATGRHDKGFDVIRRLEEDERFDYDFYIFPSEYIIRKIQREYVETKIVVVLDKRSIRLQIYPELPDQVCGYLTYEVEGTGGEYCIGLAKGPSQLSLKTSGLDAEKTTWIIDGRTLADGSFKVGKDFVNVGGITIHLGLEQKFSRLLMISPVGEVSQVDLASQKALILSEDAGKWTGNNETLQQHLGKLAREHRLSEHFVVVNNYIAEDRGQKREVGRAYYDAFSDRMLYTDVEADIGCEFIDVLPDSDEPLRSELPNGRVYTAADAEKDANVTRDAFLGAVVGNDAYFFNTQYKSLWRVNAETHQITAKYFTSTQFEDADIQMSAVSQDGDLLSMAIRPINQSGRGVEEIMHHIHKDSMVLSSVIGNSDMFRRIRVMERLSLSELVGARETPGTMITLEKLAGQALVLPSIAELVTVLCKDENGDQFCCWLRTSDDTIIRANVQPRINDLILTTSSHKEHGREVFYFYSIKEEAVYCQQGPGHVNDSQAKQIKIPGLAKLFSVLGEVFAATKDGCILRLLVDGSLYLEAVNEHWLAQHPKWWLELPTLDGKMATSIAVMGVQDSKNRVVPIWYQDGKVVIASSKLHGKQLQFMGFNGDGQAAWLFDRENGLLYRQPLSTSGVMGAMVNSEGKLINEGDHEIPEAEAMLGGERLKDPATVDGSLRVTTESGVVLVVGGHSGMASLVAVDSAWQSSHEKEDLNNLANNWPPHCDVVVLQGDSDESVPGWYYFPSRETVTAQGLKWSDHPAWIGKSIDGLTSYIYARAHCSLYGVDRASGVTSEKGKFTAAKVHGNSLVLQSTTPNAEINIPTVVGLDFAVVSATNAKVVIDEENWKRYKVIQINNKMEGNGDPMVEIKYSDEHFLIHKVGNDMVLVDGHRGSVLILANVLAEEAEQGGYKVKVGLGIDGKEFMISGFRKRLEKAHPLLEDGIFSVTEIIDLLKFKENTVVL